MQVKVIAPFNDITVEDATDRRREVGTTFDATPERAEYLAQMGFIEKPDAQPEPLNLTLGMAAGATPPSPVN